MKKDSIVGKLTRSENNLSLIRKYRPMRKKNLAASPSEKNLKKQIRVVKKMLTAKHDTNKSGGSEWTLNYKDILKIDGLITAANLFIKTNGTKATMSDRHLLENQIMRWDRKN